MTPFGEKLLDDLFVVSWLGMTAPRLDCHVYALRGANGILLIDCGTPWGHERLVSNLRHWGLRFEDVRTVLLTHGHVDHVSGGYFFKQRGIEILGHREIASIVECQWEAALGNQGDPTCHRLDGFLAENDRLERCGFTIDVIGTPGHTRGCLSFLIEVNGQRCLFTGDLIMSDGLPGWHGDPGFDEQKLVASLHRVGRLDFQHLCHGHDALLNDRGALIRDGLAKYEQGVWHAPGSRLLEPVAGRKRASATHRRNGNDRSTK